MNTQNSPSEMLAILRLAIERNAVSEEEARMVLRALLGLPEAPAPKK